MEAFKTFLKQEVANTPQRYKFNFEPTELEQALMFCYHAEVKKRGGTTILDEQTKRNIQKVVRWLRGDGTDKAGLLLYGGVGNGKTTLLNAIRSLINLLNVKWGDAYAMKVVSASDTPRLRKQGEEYWYNLQGTYMLGIDDLGTEPLVVNDYGTITTPIVDLIYHRYDMRRFTIITSNLDDKAIEERYKVRVADRMNEMFDRIYFDASSYRK